MTRTGAFLVGLGSLVGGLLLLGVADCNVLAPNTVVLKPISTTYIVIQGANGTREAVALPSECPHHSSIDEFPEDLFTEKQRSQGAVVLHILGAIYFFTLLAVLCNDYFLPSVECICEDLNISKDVAAATFMATATTTPEFFTNVISTFVMDSDLGVGTIIGSLMFNTLGVAALAGMATSKPVQLDRWPITRDCILFSIHIVFLVWFAWDAKITLNESIVLVVLYFVYFVILFNNKNMVKVYDRLMARKQVATKRTSYDLPSPLDIVPSIYPGTYTASKFVAGDERLQARPSPGVLTISGDPLGYPGYMMHQDSFTSKMASIDRDLIAGTPTSSSLCAVSAKKRKSLWSLPEGSVLRTMWWAYTWPIKCLLTVTVPNPKTWRRLYPVTFAMCVLFIGMNSYLIVWMITIMGHTFSVPESVMGLTFLAAGACMPEAISSVLMVRKGEGGIGVSNSLGANSLAILMSLGVPWMIRNIIYRNDPNKSYIRLDSADIEYTIMSLLLATVVLYAVISYCKYTLKRSVGFTLICVYLVFITLCILLEMDILFPTNQCR